MLPIFCNTQISSPFLHQKELCHAGAKNTFDILAATFFSNRYPNPTHQPKPSTETRNRNSNRDPQPKSQPAKCGLGKSVLEKTFENSSLVFPIFLDTTLD
jgi:hypothetical protein